MSADIQDIKKNKAKLSERRVRELVAAARQEPHYVSPEKTTTAYALSEWSKEEHVSLFFLTIITRQLFSLDERIRAGHFANHALSINSRPVAKSFLFRDSPDFTSNVFYMLCDSMGRMHLHNVFPANDTLHQSIVDVISADKQVAYLSFFFEFSYLTQYENRPRVLKRYADMEPTVFAKTCWAKQILPISPRFGQGDQKATQNPCLKHYINTFFWISLKKSLETKMTRHLSNQYKT